jgi:hypothetical protein
MSSRQVKKLWTSLWESRCWWSCSASKLLRESVARQVVAVVAVGVAPYTKLPSDKALDWSLAP